MLERINSSTCVAVDFNSSQDIGFFHEIMLCKWLTVQVFSSSLWSGSVFQRYTNLTKASNTKLIICFVIFLYGL